MSKLTFKCQLCKETVVSGEMFKVDVSYYNDAFNLSDELLFDEICGSCTTEIESKIISLRKKD